MKRNAFVTILAIATMALSSICTPCQAQSTNFEKAEEPRKNYEFQQVEQVPEFPGGMSALVEYLQQEIKYPKKCREAGIEGRTLITFVVKKNGKINTACNLNEKLIPSAMKAQLYFSLYKQ